MRCRSASCRCASCRAESSSRFCCASCSACASCCARSGLAISTVRSCASLSIREGGATNVSSTERSKAITACSGAGAGAGAGSACPSARERSLAGASPVTDGGAGLLPLSGGAGVARARLVAASAAAAGLTLPALASAGPVGAGATGGVTTGTPAYGRTINPCCNGSATDETAGCEAASCAGTSTMRRSGTSIRRSRQGTLKPGMPSPCSSNVRFNSDP